VTAIGAPRSIGSNREKKLFKTLAIASGLGTTAILGLATMSVLSVNLATPAHASCRHNFADCADVVILVCPGGRTFVGGSDIGNAEDIARIKARGAGYDPDDCRARPH
jgi:hypothetical protein